MSFCLPCTQHPRVSHVRWKQEPGSRRLALEPLATHTEPALRWSMQTSPPLPCLQPSTRATNVAIRSTTARSNHPENYLLEQWSKRAYKSSPRHTVVGVGHASTRKQERSSGVPTVFAVSHRGGRPTVVFLVFTARTAKSSLRSTY